MGCVICCHFNYWLFMTMKISPFSGSIYNFWFVRALSYRHRLKCHHGSVFMVFELLFHIPKLEGMLLKTILICVLVLI